MGTAPAPPPRLYRIWAGVYGGVQVGEDFRGVDFRSVPSTPIRRVLTPEPRWPASIWLKARRLRPKNS
jgi:hypothetical protein